MNNDSRFLSRVIIDITNKCNLNCIMCGVPLSNEEKYDMPLDLYKKIAQQTFLYTRSVWLSCAYEAFLAKDFLEIISFLKGVPTSALITNGTLLNKINIAKIIQVGLGRLFISFDGAKKETFEKIRKGADFEKIISNIELINNLKENLSSSRPELCFSTTLMRSNIEQFPLIVQLAYQLKINIISCKPVDIFMPELEKEALGNFYELTTCYYIKAQELANELGIKLEPAPYLLELTKREQKLSKSANVALNKTNEPKKCREYLPVLFISPDGKVKPCTRWEEGPIGDFTNQSFWEIWEADEFKKLRNETESGNFRESCLQCPYLV